VSLEEAARYSGDIRLFKKADLTVSLLGISRDVALDIHRRAQEGDKDAQVRIRSGRCSQHCERRIVKDGWAYTLEQFQIYYGASSARHWEEASTMMVRPLQGRSPRLLEFTEEERRFGGEEDSKLWYAVRYEVKVFGVWLPLVQLLAYDFSIPRKEILVQAPVEEVEPVDEKAYWCRCGASQTTTLGAACTLCLINIGLTQCLTLQQHRTHKLTLP